MGRSILCIRNIFLLQQFLFVLIFLFSILQSFGLLAWCGLSFLVLIFYIDHTIVLFIVLGSMLRFRTNPLIQCIFIKKDPNFSEQFTLHFKHNFTSDKKNHENKFSFRCGAIIFYKFNHVESELISNCNSMFFTSIFY